VSGLILGHHSRHLEMVWDAVGWAFPAGVTFVAFSLLYRYIPDVKHGLHDVWPGAVVAALLFEAAKHGFTVYVANFSRYELVYGALGAVMLFLLWIYLSAMILLLGAELASVWEREVPHRGREAAPGRRLSTA
jgi:membrane protein